MTERRLRRGSNKTAEIDRHNLVITNQQDDYKKSIEGFL